MLSVQFILESNNCERWSPIRFRFTCDLFYNWDEVVNLIMVNCQFHVHLFSHWPLNDPMVEAWPHDSDPKYKAAKSEKEKLLLPNSNDFVFIKV